MCLFLKSKTSVGIIILSMKNMRNQNTHLQTAKIYYYQNENLVY